MADVDITYGCGCGFKTRRLEAAIEHLNTKHHTLTVLGIIKSTKVIKPASQINKSKPQARTAKDLFKQGLEDMPGLSRIDELRHKINGRR